MKQISQVASGIAPSATLSIDALAKQMKADGINVIGFGAGEPDYNTPDHIKAAGIKAINENQTRYTPVAGIIPLRKAICDFLRRDFGLAYNPNQICVSSGAKHNIYLTLQTILNPGDEVILPTPYWVTYEEAIKMAGGVPVLIETTEADSFKLTAERLQAAITEKTKCFILNNPSNPTGMLYTKDELKSLADVIVKNDIYCLSDEIYYSLVYSGEFVSIATFGEEIKKRTIIINGVSKAYAMTGWRIGFAAANEEIAKVMTNYCSHSTGSACSISQFASLEAIAGDQSEVYAMKDAFDERRKYLVSRISAIEGCSCLEPDGAFYVFMNAKKLLDKKYFGEMVNTSSELAASLLKNGLVAVVPGSAFGAEGYIRWSYAVSMENIKEGLDRFEKFLKG
ncbi:MAG: pyridoxal phosphate-dependent aminotransferase [Oscillospiraceae bacterium]